VRLLLTALLLLSALAPMAAPVSAADHQVTAEDCIQHARHGERMVVDDDGPVATISRTDNDTVIRYSFNGTTDDLEFWLPAGSRVINSSGFQINDDHVERKYNGRHPTITLHYTGPAKGISAAATEEHFLFLLPYSDSTTLQFETNETAYIGGRFALLGEYDTATAEADCQHIQVVAPTAADVNLDHYAQVLAEASRDLDIGPRYAVVTAFVAPRDTGKRNGYAPEAAGEGGHGAAEFLVSPDSVIESPLNTLVHEYIHTRQARLEPKWISEGSAMFLTIALGVENGWISSLEADAFYESKADSDRRVADDVVSSMVPYVRGAFFFDSLSEQLAGTNASVETVYREINVQNYRDALRGRPLNEVTRDRFVAVAAEQSGTEVTPDNRVQYENPSWLLAIAGPIIREPVAAAIFTSVLGVAALKWLIVDDSEGGEEDER